MTTTDKVRGPSASARTPQLDPQSNTPAAPDAAKATPESPFSVAERYRALGWKGTLPLPYGKKQRPPTGFTGLGGHNPSDKAVSDWSKKRHSICLRMPKNVLGIDVDAYAKGGRQKVGDHTLRAFEDRLGPLPATYRSSARGAEPSSTRFYRVPAGHKWRDLGEDVESIHWGHRYSVVWPSANPDAGGALYQWYGPDGEPCDPPAVADLPELPPAWIEELDEGLPTDAELNPGPSLSLADVEAWLDGCEDPNGQPCQRVAARLEQAALDLDPAKGSGSRHDAMANHSLAILRLGHEGHRGVRTALEQLELTFDASFGEGEGRHSADPNEYGRAVSGGIRKVEAEPTPEDERGCDCSTPEEDFGVLEDRIFTATETLGHIRQAAHARMIGADALLVCVLARVLAEVPPEVCLPAVVGSRASLNLGIALVGESGGGKSATLEVSRDLLGLRGLHQRAEIERIIGSGEGMVETFLRDELTDSTPPKKTGRKVLIDDPRRILVADEIDQLAAIGGRNGATLGPVMRSALTGGTLGQENAAADRRRHVEGGTYRLVLIAGVQPTRAGALLQDTEAGTPQRFLWVSVLDPSIPDYEDLPDWPGELGWEMPELPAEIEYPKHVKQDVLKARQEQLRNPDADPAEGHRLLVRLKVASALAVLHGEDKITDQWWDIAGDILARSMAEQTRCREAIRRKAEEERREAGKLDASRAAAAAGAVAERVELAAKAIWRGVVAHGTPGRVSNQKHDSGEGCTRRCITAALKNYPDREAIRDAALEHALEEAWVVRREGDRIHPGEEQP